MVLISEDNSDKKDLADFLLETQVIDEIAYKDLKRAAKTSDMSFLQVLESEDIVSERVLKQAVKKVTGYNYVNLLGKEISKEALNEISLESARHYGFVIFEKQGSKVKVGITNLEDFSALEALEFVADQKNLEYEIFVITQASLEAALNQYETLRGEVGEVLKEIGKELGAKTEEETMGMLEEKAEEIVEAAPISRAVSVILKHAIEGKASDIHIEPQEKDLRVRYRVDGILYSSLILSKKIHPAVVARIKVLTNLKLDEVRLPQDGRFRCKVAGKDIDFRVSTVPAIHGEKVVMRILDKTAGSFSLNELGIFDCQLSILKKAISKANGMLLLTGPTGCGKTSTLYAGLSNLNKMEVNIVTLEDPVEYLLDGINQIQVNPAINFTFASGLRSLVRQDPDIIMVGEIRDKETAELAIHAALTGHLVLSTLHTNSAVGAIPRLVDMGIEPFLLVSGINAVAAQRLVRKICRKCRKEIPMPEKMRSDAKKELESLPDSVLKKLGISLDNMKFYHGEGCAHCGNQGYQGRTSIFEIIPLSTKIQELIITRKPSEVLFDQAQKEGMISMKQDGIIKALKGITTIEEVLRVISE